MFKEKNIFTFIFLYLIYFYYFVAKTKPTLPTGWELEEYLLTKLLSKDAKVLFIYAVNYETIRKITEQLNIHATILNDDFEELEKARNFGFEVIQGNINAGAMDNFHEKEFSHVVCEVGLNSARYPNDFLKSATKIGENFVLYLKNDVNFIHRIKFLFHGSLYVHNQYDVIPDDEFAWFNRDPWFLSHKDIINMCACSGLTIDKGIMIYKKGSIDNIYDLRCYPNFSAVKVYYSISDKTNIQPIYKLGNAIT